MLYPGDNDGLEAALGSLIWLWSGRLVGGGRHRRAIVAHEGGGNWAGGTGDWPGLGGGAQKNPQSKIISFEQTGWGIWGQGEREAKPRRPAGRQDEGV